MARVSFKTAAQLEPRQGNRELPVSWDFTSAAILYDDLLPEMQSGQIDVIQNVYIDNADNATSLTLTILTTGQRIVAQPYSQGIYPIASCGSLRYSVATTTGQVIKALFSNIPKPFNTWGQVPGVLVVPALTNIAVDLAPALAADNILVAGVVNTTIKVYRLLFGFAAANNVKFWSGASVNAHPLSGTLPMFAGGGITMEPSGVPWLTTRTGDDLVMVASAAQNIGGVLGYVQS